MIEILITYRFSFGRPEGEGRHGIHHGYLEDSIKMYPKEMLRKFVTQILVDQNRVQWWTLVKRIKNLCVIGEFHDYLRD